MFSRWPKTWPTAATTTKPPSASNKTLETNVRADLDATVAAQENYKAALSAKTDFSTAVIVADSNGKAFIGSARRVLANNLGETWSNAWTATGFPDLSTAVPATQAKRQALLLSLKNLFRRQPRLRSQHAQARRHFRAGRRAVHRAVRRPRRRLRRQHRCRQQKGSARRRRTKPCATV